MSGKENRQRAISKRCDRAGESDTGAGWSPETAGKLPQTGQAAPDADPGLPHQETGKTDWEIYCHSVSISGTGIYQMYV